MRKIFKISIIVDVKTKIIFFIFRSIQLDCASQSCISGRRKKSPAFLEAHLSCLCPSFPLEWCSTEVVPCRPELWWQWCWWCWLWWWWWWKWWYYFWPQSIDIINEWCQSNVIFWDLNQNHKPNISNIGSQPTWWWLQFKRYYHDDDRIFLDPNQPDQRTRQPPAWLSDAATPKAEMKYNWIKTC